MNDENIVTGLMSTDVFKDVLTRLAKAQDSGNKLYQNEMMSQVEKLTGIKIANNSLAACRDGPSGGNDTVLLCPQGESSNAAKDEFLMVVHNPSAQQKMLLKVMLATKNYKAQVFDTLKGFVDIPTDVFEQTHFDYAKKNFTDFMMYIPVENFPAGSIKVFKIQKATEEQQKKIEDEQVKLSQKSSNGNSLKVLGLGPSNDILFQY